MLTVADAHLAVLFALTHNGMHQKENQINVLANVLRWFLGVLFLLAGIAVAETDILYGAFIIVSGVVLLPPVIKAINHEVKGRFNWWKQILVTLCLPILGIFVSEGVMNNRIEQNSTQSQVVEEDLISDNAVPIGEKYVYDITGLVTEMQDHVGISSEPNPKSQVDEIQFGEKVTVYEVDEASGYSLVTYTHHYEQEGQALTSEAEGWIGTVFLISPDEYALYLNPGIEFSGIWISEGVLGDPVANLSITNNTGKEIDGVKLYITAVNNFGELVTNSISGEGKFLAYSQERIANGAKKQMKWDLFLYESATSLSIEIFEVSFSDGTSWNGSLETSMADFFEKVVSN